MHAISDRATGVRSNAEGLCRAPVRANVTRLTPSRYDDTVRLVSRQPSERSQGDIRVCPSLVDLMMCQRVVGMFVEARVERRTHLNAILNGGTQRSARSAARPSAPTVASRPVWLPHNGRLLIHRRPLVRDSEQSEVIDAGAVHTKRAATSCKCSRTTVPTCRRGISPSASHTVGRPRHDTSTFLKRRALSACAATAGATSIDSSASALERIVGGWLALLEPASAQQTWRSSRPRSIRKEALV